MLKKITYLLFAATLMVACGENQTTSVIIKPKSISMSGDLGAYYEVVDNDYTVEIDESSFMKAAMLTVAVKRNQTDLDFKTDNINPFGTNGGEDYHVGFGVEIFNDNSPMIIKSANDGSNGPYSSSDVTKLITLKKGETGFIRWSIDGNKLAGLKTFQITSALKKENNSVVSAASSFDDLLRDYEVFIDSYIALFKRSQQGDVNALAEYAEVMENATALTTEIEDAKGELTVAQLRKFSKLQTKLATAVSGSY